MELDEYINLEPASAAAWCCWIFPPPVRKTSSSQSGNQMNDLEYRRKRSSSCKTR
jgi:hypothetical protein